MLEKSQVKSGPLRSQNLTVFRESDSPQKITSINGLGRVFFGFLHKKWLAGRILFAAQNFFTIDPMLGGKVVPKKAQI